MNQTVEVKTSELVGAALNWAVLAAVEVNGNQSYWKSQVLARPESYTYRPSTDWSQGGPLIERERIEIRNDDDTKEWSAQPWDQDEYEQNGSTPLIAAMRCLVASKLGDTVQVPAELIHP